MSHKINARSRNWIEDAYLNLISSHMRRYPQLSPERLALNDLLEKRAMPGYRKQHNGRNLTTHGYFPYDARLADGAIREEPFPGNEKTHDLYPYDPNNPFRTERQRLINQGIDPDAYEDEMWERDKAKLKVIAVVAVIIALVWWLS